MLVVDLRDVRLKLNLFKTTFTRIRKAFILFSEEEQFERVKAAAAPTSVFDRRFTLTKKVEWKLQEWI